MVWMWFQDHEKTVCRGLLFCFQLEYTEKDVTEKFSKDIAAMERVKKAVFRMPNKDKKREAVRRIVR